MTNASSNPNDPGPAKNPAPASVPVPGLERTPTRPTKLPKGLKKEPIGHLTYAAITASFFAGTASGMLSSNALPFKTFDWILEHGIQGFMLVTIFFLGLALIRTQKRVETQESERAELEGEFHVNAMRGERNHYAERVSLERETRGLLEGLLREQLDVHTQTGALADKAADAALAAAAAAKHASEAAVQAAEAARRCAEERNKP